MLLKISLIIYFRFFLCVVHDKGDCIYYAIAKIRYFLTVLIISINTLCKFIIYGQIYYVVFEKMISSLCNISYKIIARFFPYLTIYFGKVGYK